MNKLYAIFIIVSIGMIIPGLTEAQRSDYLNTINNGKKILIDLKTFPEFNDYEPIVHHRQVRMIQKAKAEIINVSPGQLSTILTANQETTITNLKLIGQIDARDFKTMRDDMPVLSDIDLSNITIAAYSGPLGTAGPTDFTYPANTIPQSAFISDTRLLSIIFPASITSIGNSAFYNCGLSGVLSLPNAVDSIGDSAFESCWNLTGALTLPNSLTTIGTYTFADCQNLTGLTLSNSLKSISDHAFDGNWSMSGNLTIPNSVTSIGQYAFFYCYLTGVTIPNSVTLIDMAAFEKCKYLTGNLIIPNSITSISPYAFSLCSRLTNITLPNSVTSIGIGAFMMSGLTSITLPNSVTSIGEGAFLMSYLSGSQIIPNSVISLGIGAFSLTGISEFVVQDDNPNFSVFDGVLFNKNKTSLKAYPSNKKGTYTIPNFVTLIDTSAFYYSNALTEIIIPNSVQSIANNAFEGCFELVSIVAYSTTPIDLSQSTDVFKDFNYSTVTLYVPAGTKILYQSANQWDNFTNIVEMAPTGINELTDIESVLLYPNPVTDGCYIDAGENSATVTLFDLNGIQLLSRQVINKNYLDMTWLPQGQYIVKIITSKGIVEKKLVKK